MKKKKKPILPALPINRLIEPEELGGDPVGESKNTDSDLSKELSFRKEDIPIKKVPDQVPDPAPVPEGQKPGKLQFPQWG